MGFLDAAIGSIGQDLAKTAVDSLSQSTGVNVGGTLAYLFGNDQPKGGANMDALGTAVAAKFANDQKQLTLLQAGLFQQSQALAAMGSQLTGIANALTRITGMIQNVQQMLKEIGQEQLFQEWQAVDDKMTDYIAAINSAFATYGNYTTGYKTTPPTLVNGLIGNILDVNGGPIVGLRAIHDFMMGGGQERGALQLWSSMVTPLVQSGSVDYRLAVEEYFQYYQKLTYAQLKATNLLMEAYNFHGDHNNAKVTWDQYKGQILDQEDAFISGLVPLVFAGEQGGVFVPPGGTQERVNFTAYDAATQLNPGVQFVRGNSANKGDAYYTPSSIFTAAEQLLANLYVTDSADRRIVVHMLYPNGSGINTLLDGLKLTLSRTGSSTTVGSTSDSRLGGPFPFPTLDDYSPWFPDQNVYSGDGFYLKRYVFTGADGAGIKDGQYTVTDLNGHDGLVPLQTYLSGERSLPAVPFQQHAIVSYRLQVNHAKPFDFMNFAAYTMPSLLPG